MTIYNNHSKHSTISNVLFNRYCICYPDSFRIIGFKKGKKEIESLYRYNEALKNIELVMEITYKEDGDISKTVEYKDGKKEEK
jgi:hypothetical protein